MLEFVDAPVLQALQLMLQVRSGEWQPGVELQRGREDLRGQSPATPLELRGDQAVEVHHVEREQHAGHQQDGQRAKQEGAEELLASFQRNSSTAGSRRL